jgi:thioredoxin 1
MTNEKSAGSRRTRLNDRIGILTSRTFKPLVLDAEGSIAVEFMSYVCAHCRTIEPFLQQVAETLKSKERIFKVNIAVERELARSYEIRGTPTLVMFLHSREVGRVEGPHPATESILAAVTEPFEEDMRQVPTNEDADTEPANPFIQ